MNLTMWAKMISARPTHHEQNGRTSSVVCLVVSLNSFSCCFFSCCVALVGKYASKASKGVLFSCKYTRLVMIYWSYMVRTIKFEVQKSKNLKTFWSKGSSVPLRYCTDRSKPQKVHSFIKSLQPFPISKSILPQG